MKHKYILENYDRILKEIKSPRIIFNNDLEQFLNKLSIDSLFVHQIDFYGIDNNVKYSIKKPIHNLDPRYSKIKPKKSTTNSQFENYIPLVLEDLNFDSKDVKWNWHSKNRNTLYIFEKCQVEHISQELRLFLYCYQTLKKENYRIKKVNKDRIYNLNSKAKIEQYIHQKQHAIENLAQSLIKEIGPKDFSCLYQFSNKYDKTDCLKIIYIYIEKLHRYIEKEYKNFLNTESNIPYRSIFCKELELNKKIKRIKNALLNSDIEDQLLKISYEPLIRIESLTVKETLTYYEFNYKSVFINELHKIIENNTISEETLFNCLFDLNFNSLIFFKYITDNISKTIESLESNIQKIDKLYLILKCYNQKQIKNSKKYKNNLPSIKDQIISWLDEEIEYCTRKINLDSNQFRVPQENEIKTKFLSSLSVAQLSCFFGLLMETEIIKHKNQTDVLKFVAQNFRTKNTEKISLDSLRVKYYNVETGTKTAIREKIIELLSLAKN